MKYQVHDQVVHWNYGPGEIIGIEKKRSPEKLYNIMYLPLSGLLLGTRRMKRRKFAAPPAGRRWSKR